MEHFERRRETQNGALQQVYQVADSIQAAGEALLGKVSGRALGVYRRFTGRHFSEDGATETSTDAPFDSLGSEVVELGIGAVRVAPGPSGVDIVAQAAPPEDPEPPVAVETDTRDVEHIAPIGAGMARDMLRRAQGE